MPRIKVDHVEPDIKPVEVKPPTATAAPVLHNTDQILKDKSGGASLSAFLAFPDGVKFQGETDDEKIVLLHRQHLITTAPSILLVALLYLAPFILFPIFFSYNFLPDLSAGYKFILTLFWYFSVSTYGLLRFLSWYFNVYIVTNERVVDVDWYSLTYKRVTNAQISKIQNTTLVTSSVLESIFDFGNIHIETAGNDENIEFEKIPHPALVKKKIDELMQKEEEQWEERP